MKHIFASLGLILSPSIGMAQVMSTPDRTVNRSLPNDYDLSKDTEFQKKYREMIRSEESARAALREAGGSVPPPSQPLEDSGAMLAPAGVPTKLPERPRTRARASTPVPTLPPNDRDHQQIVPAAVAATPALVYAVSRESTYDENMTVLPLGSFVKAKVVSGVEANTLEPYPVLLQLEYAFTGPNETKVNLSRCFMIAKARANLSTERVIMETDRISCVRENGEHFESSARGYTAGTDSTFGSTGTFISKQGTVMLAAVLASIAKNAGEAVAAAQQTTTIAAGGMGAAQTAQNVTGDQTKYIAGRSVVDGATMIAQWYLDYAKQLVPSIAVGSGEDIHVVMLETIRVPTLQD